MATVNLYLDARKLNKNNEAPVKIIIRSCNTSVMRHTNVVIPIVSWDDEKKKVVRHPRASYYNKLLQQTLLKVQGAMMEVSANGYTKLKAKELSLKIDEILCPRDEKPLEERFVFRFEAYSQSRRSPRTREIYGNTQKKIMQFASNAEELTFEDVDALWIKHFDDFLEKNGCEVNTRSIHLRNIRAAIRDAIAEGIASNNPFTKYKIRSASTSKRALSIEQLRKLFSLRYTSLYHTAYYNEYVDVIKLMFMLIGINIVDLLHLRKEDYMNGYIDYDRRKTGKHYHIKVEPEAQEIIERLRGKKYLLSMMDRYKSYKDYAQHLNNALRKMGINDEITTYWSRHSWATIASKLDIPIDTISAALGHSNGSKVTSVYIDFDLKKVEDANRKVIDFVLYNK